jgi:hypothetical protein
VPALPGLDALPTAQGICVGLRSPRNDYFLGNDGRTWRVARPAFSRDALPVGTYIDVKDAAQVRLCARKQCDGTLV